MTRAAFRHLTQVYRHAPLLARIHVMMRAQQCPFESVARHVPPTGTVLDIGVGHGVFLHVLHREGKPRRLLGLDIADDKLRIARSTVRNGENMEFYQGYLPAVPPEPVHCISLMDSAYLIPDEQWLPLLDALW